MKINQKYFPFKITFIGSCIIYLISCKTPFNPQVRSSNIHDLVVEGYLNTNGETNIKLSRTRNITWGDTASFINETNATVLIEDNQNNVYPLNETQGGNYTGTYFLNSLYKYRLHIITSDQREYLSDFVECKISPSIDNVAWNLLDGGIQISLDTHDPNNNTKYYLWSYTETWEFHSQYFSNVKYNPIDTTVVTRTVPVVVCYRQGHGTSILLGSSAKLSQDVIHEAPILYIPNHDKRIAVLYSMLISQFALDSNAYNYLSAMKSNTEHLGSIFDPQPNQTKGNIHCVSDTTEIVIGYVGSGAATQKRIFISNSEIPSDWNLPPNCIEYKVPNNKDSIYKWYSGNSLVPYLKDSGPNGTVKGYFSASGTCVDCTLSGTPDKPTYWP